MSLSIIAFGQKEVTTVPEDAPLLENIHLHLNKMAFFKGERLWFQAYVQNQNQRLPSTTTTNLHVGIFSEEGKEIAKKMFYVNNGVCYGDFEIDSTFVADSYTIMAWTNYMKNFKEATPFLQKITILGTAERTSLPSKSGMTISIHPEGQHIVANAYNSVGLMVYDHALNPVSTDGIQLVTEDGTQIQSNIQTNEVGQGRFGFYASPDKSYFLKVKDDNDQTHRFLNFANGVVYDFVVCLNN